MNKPYVISAELELLGSNQESVVNQSALDSFREGLDRDLRDLGKSTVWVPASTIADGLVARIASRRRPVVSLDSRYVKGANCLHWPF